MLNMDRAYLSKYEVETPSTCLPVKIWRYRDCQPCWYYELETIGLVGEKIDLADDLTNFNGPRTVCLRWENSFCISCIMQEVTSKAFNRFSFAGLLYSVKFASMLAILSFKSLFLFVRHRGNCVNMETPMTFASVIWSM